MGDMGPVGEKKKRMWCDKWGDEGQEKAQSFSKGGGKRGLGSS